MILRVLVNGAFGRMGQQTVKAIQETDDLTLVAATGSRDNLAEAIKQSDAQIVIDFTNAAVAYRNALIIIDAGVHPVIGTSGFLPEQIQILQNRSSAKKLGGVIAPNFSIGAVLMMKYAQDAARYFPDAEIIEMHHTGKLDAPSGTAIKTAAMIAEARKYIPAAREEKEIITGARGANHQGIPIHSVRIPGVLAQQTVILGGQGETLTIHHDTLNRETFMAGVLLACRKVVQLDNLVYGLEHIL